MVKVRRNAYYCDGNPECCKEPWCALFSHGTCDHTTDLMYAVNRKKLVTDDIYYRLHMRRFADSDTEEWWIEE